MSCSIIRIARSAGSVASASRIDSPLAGRHARHRLVQQQDPRTQRQAPVRSRPAAARRRRVRPAAGRASASSRKRRAGCPRLLRATRRNASSGRNRLSTVPSRSWIASLDLPPHGDAGRQLRDLEGARQPAPDALPAARSCVTSAPSSQTLPALGCSTPVTRLTSVVLPAPLGPISPTRSPACSASDTWRVTCRPPKDLLRPPCLQQRRRHGCASGLRGRSRVIAATLRPAPGSPCRVAPKTGGRSSQPALARHQHHEDQQPADDEQPVVRIDGGGDVVDHA